MIYDSRRGIPGGEPCLGLGQARSHTSDYPIDHDVHATLTRPDTNLRYLEALD